MDIKLECERELRKEIAQGWLYIAFLRVLIEGNPPRWLTSPQFNHYLGTGEWPDE